MLSIKIDGLAEVREGLREFSDRRLNSAIATALTRSAKVIEQDWKKQLTSRSDRPTPATVGAVRTTFANGSRLEAEVKIRDEVRNANGTPPVKWLAPSEAGGERQTKKFERALQARGAMPVGWKAVPGPAAKLDGFGNVGRGQIVQVLAKLGAALSPGYARVISGNAAKRAAKAARTGRTYVAVPPGKGRLPPGIYERKKNGLTPVFYFVRSTRYEKRLDLVGNTQRDVATVFDEEFARAVRESAARMRAATRTSL